MPPKTINLRSDAYEISITLLRGVHFIEPIGFYINPLSGTKYLIFENTPKINAILECVDKITDYIDCQQPNDLSVFQEYLLDRAGIKNFDDADDIAEKYQNVAR